MQGDEDWPPGGALSGHAEVAPLAGHNVLALVLPMADQLDMVGVSRSPRQRGEVRTGAVTLAPGEGGRLQESRGLGHLLEWREGEITE